MALKVPQNKIKESKYTSGGEYIIKDTNAPYKGYYYELNNTLYAGKSYDPKSPIIIPIQDRNTLLQNPLTALYSAVSGLTSQNLKSPTVSSLPNTTYIPPGDITPKFYCKQINQQPVIIKQIDENTYISLQNNPLYQTTYTGNYKNKTQTIEQANQQMPGLKIFLGV